MDYFIGDTHFNHAAIIAHTNRPFVSISQMNRHMIKMWNSVVKPGDRVFHLGDFALTDFDTGQQILAALEGEKILIRGNHDRMSTKNFIKMGFTGVYKTLEYFGRFILSHRPLPEDRLNGKWNIHGHIHGPNPFQGRYINVSADNLIYKPISGESIIETVEQEGRHDYINIR